MPSASAGHLPFPRCTKRCLYSFRWRGRVEIISLYAYKPKADRSHQEKGQWEILQIIFNSSFLSSFGLCPLILTGFYQAKSGTGTLPAPSTREQEQAYQLKSNLFFGYFRRTSPPSNTIHSTAASILPLPFRPKRQTPASVQMPQHTLQPHTSQISLVLNSAGVYN